MPDILERRSLINSRATARQWESEAVREIERLRQEIAALRSGDPVPVAPPPENRGVAYLDSESELDFNPFRCKCGCLSTGGGHYCNYIKCPRCSRLYKFPLVEGIVMEEVTKTEYGIVPVLLSE